MVLLEKLSRWPTRSHRVRTGERGDWVQVERPWEWPESLEGHDHDPDLRKKRIASLREVMGILFPPKEHELLLEQALLPAAKRSLRTSVVGL